MAKKFIAFFKKVLLKKEEKNIGGADSTGWLGHNSEISIIEAIIAGR